MITCDALVIGAGGVGSAAMMHLADAGLRVIGVDQHVPPHSFGSSHGQTRCIRQAYFEHPDYVPLLRRAYALWDALEQRSGAALFHRVGLLEAGPSDGIVVPGVLESAQQHQLPVQRWTVDEARQRVPAIHLDESFEVVFEENAGFLLVEECVAAHCQLAKAAGAELHHGAVRELRVVGPNLEVRTDRHLYQAPLAVLATGAWAKSVLAELNVPLPLQVVRKHLHWHPTEDARYDSEIRRGLSRGEGPSATTFPVFFVEEQVDETGMQRFFYGFPKLDDRGVKVAEHSDGTGVEDAGSDPRTVEQKDQRRVSDFVGRRLENVELQSVDHTVCFYTMSPDDHFIVDSAPMIADNSPNVVFAAGLSGHGFKFATVLGEVLSQMAMGVAPDCDINFLRLSRFANG